MRRRPPHFRRQAVAEIAKRLDCTGEKQRLAERHDFWFEALLPGLGQESFCVWRDDHSSNDFDVVFLERCDLRGEITVHVLETTRIEQCETFLGKRSGESALFVAPRVAVAIIWKQAADFLVGLHRFPAGQEIADDVLEAPEHVISPIEPFPRIALATKEPRLPGCDGRYAGNLV